PLWILVVLVSGILFLGYAKVGSRGDQEVHEGWPPAFRLHETLPQPLPSTPTEHPAPAEHPIPAAPPRAGAGRPWWVH
ncbi:MAG TPA: hypothetical protein VGY96_00460, partial [Streptosporangiaceae bacterium]|nr:hypothetical protein [Streptosporangiaceae bacterium]